MRPSEGNGDGGRLDDVSEDLPELAGIVSSVAAIGCLTGPGTRKEGREEIAEGRVGREEETDGEVFRSVHPSASALVSRSREDERMAYRREHHSTFRQPLTA